MYEVSTSLYNHVADKLIAAIGTKEYFSGHIGTNYDNVECELRCTLFIARELEPADGGNFRPITALIPVWWEFHTTVGSEELLNDFSFRELLDIAL